MAYRVGELATAAGVSVELIRSYQTKGLLDAPRRSGRVALYDQRHLQRLHAIRDLKAKGYSLKAIAGLLERSRPSEIERVIPGPAAAGEDDHLDIHELADRTRVPLAVLRSLEASGVIRPRPGERPYYTSADVRAVRMLLSLIGVGLPLEEFLRLARLQIAAMQEVAGGAVDLYARYVEEPLQRAGLDPAEEAERADAAFGLLVQAATSLVAYGFERALHTARAGEEAKRAGAHAATR